MSQNKPELPKQIVPYPGCPPLTVATSLSVANRFSSLGSTVGLDSSQLPINTSCQYKVPWILKWSYRIPKDARIFSRQFSVKWWDKFDVDRIARYVYNDLPVEPMPRLISPTGSIRSSLSIKGKSKAELQEIARQLIMQASQMDDDEDNESPSSSSCQPIQNPIKPKSWYDDSQDPYDAYDLHSD
ncbi:hypothetical protein L3X38_032218 [Prunus dulcis]|uniref:Uncharacterized protein n=1 Tax=Prunus dulcis TaxID=3755 RepID=A0AAD4VFT7_PRUDU|nr:hypothetical protein L3X38_032218 [Prunus dulcis]